MGRRVFASAIWGIIFLIPIFATAPVKKGAILGVLPWLSSIFYMLPVKMNQGWLGLEMGLGTPIWTLFLAAFGASPARCSLPDFAHSYHFANPKTPKARSDSPAGFVNYMRNGLTLTGFEPTLGFVDHINAALTAHDAAIRVPVFQRA